MEGPALAIEFEQHRVGACVAWDRVSNLLAVELQPTDGEPGLTACILDPCCPEASGARSDAVAALHLAP